MLQKEQKYSSQNWNIFVKKSVPHSVKFSMKLIFAIAKGIRITASVTLSAI